jgi:hypothetical protein
VVWIAGSPGFACISPIDAQSRAEQTVGGVDIEQFER